MHYPKGGPLTDQTYSQHCVLQPLRSEQLVAKRLLDIAVALSGLLILAPVMAVIYLAIKLSGRGPGLFRQERIGLGGKTFGCYKFRSMVLNADEALQKFLDSDADARLEWERDHKLARDPRVTRLGRLLRKTSLDELP